MDPNTESTEQQTAPEQESVHQEPETGESSGEAANEEDEAQLSAYRAEVESLCREATRLGVAAERARIRRELLDAVSDKRSEWALAKPLGEEIVKSEREIGADAAFAAVLAALDRICSEEG